MREGSVPGEGRVWTLGAGLLSFPSRWPGSWEWRGAFQGRGVLLPSFLPRLALLMLRDEAPEIAGAVWAVLLGRVVIRLEAEAHPGQEDARCSGGGL